jgi:NAD(P)-dependent dehydrogenase (short-subunit alcohol dehydrogenase family)
MSTSDQKQDLPIDLTRQQCENAVFIVTGANTGIGLETARHLVRLGSAKVILAVRNIQAGEQALRDIEKTTTISGVAEVWHLDLASYASVQRFASRASKDLSRLDGVVENACVSVDRWGVAEGHELSLTVNVYSTFLLGVLLFPRLKDTAKTFKVLPHLVVVSSSYGFMFQSQVADLQKDGLKGLDNQSTSNMDAR